MAAGDASPENDGLQTVATGALPAFRIRAAAILLQAPFGA